MKEDTEHSAQVHSYLALRKTVGWIGILLPFVLVAGYLLIFGGERPLHNISVYYHTGMRDLFVGAICAIALFLFFYKGYDLIDNIAADIAGILALGIAFFPTVKEGPLDWVARVHFYCAGAFFVILALFSLFLFTRGETHPTDMKKRRNMIYRSCGIIMLLSMASIEIFFLFFEKNYPHSLFVFIAETITLTAFGISWLTKGGTLYPDKPQKQDKMENEENLVKVFAGPEPTALLLMARLKEIGVESLIKNDSPLGYIGATPDCVDLYVLEDDVEKARPLAEKMEKEEEE